MLVPTTTINYISTAAYGKILFSAFSCIASSYFKVSLISSLSFCTHVCADLLPEFGSQVGSTTDHFLPLPVQHGHCLSTMRVDPARVITNSGSTFLRLSIDTLDNLEQDSKYYFRHLPIVYQYFVLCLSELIVNYS